ncbi:MAG: translocation/assembly module TamB domain-containing protein, partial [Pseudomonadota bacterium]|nr:translocation/assembly module TamB domain-containing protein [Pseudomonadota bacterium]
QGLGIGTAVAEFRSSLGLRADFRTAGDLPELREAVTAGSAGVALRDIALQTPSLTADLPGSGPESELSVSDLKLAGAAEIRPGQFTARLDRLATRAEMTGYPAADIALNGELRNGRVTVGSVSARAGESEVKGHGSLILADGRVDAQMQIPHLELGDFVSGLPETIPSRLSGSVAVKGTTRTPDLTSSLAYAGGTIDAQASADLRASDPTYSLAVKVSELDIVRFLPGEQGRAGASLELEGTGLSAAARDLRLAMNLDTRGFSAVPGLHGSVRAALKGETLNVKSLDFSSEAASATARGVVSKTGRNDLSYGIELRDVSSFGRFAGKDAGGKGTVTGTIQGPAAAAKMISEADFSEWRYTGWSGGPLKLSATVEDLMVSPRVRLGGTAAGLSGPGLEIGDLVLDADFFDSAGGLAVEVTDGALSGTGIAGRITTASTPWATVDILQLQHGEYTWRNTGPVELGIEDGGAFRLSGAELTNGEQRITAAGEVSPQGRIKGRLEIERLDIGDLGAAFFPSASGVDGTIDVRADLNGTASHPALDGTIGVTGLKWEQKDLGEIHAEVRSEDAIYRGEAGWKQSGSTLMTIDGSIDLRGDGALAVRARADDFDLAILHVLGRRVQESAGRLDLDLTLGGTMKAPTANGTLALRDGVFRLRTLGARYTDIQGHVVARGTRVDIEKLSLSSGSGDATLSGWAKLRGSGLDSGELDLSLDARDFTLLSSTAFSAVVTTQIKARGTDEDLLVSGDALVSRGRFRYQNLPSSGAPKVEPWELTVEGVFGPGKSAVTSSDTAGNGARTREVAPLPFLRTDIGIDFPRNVWVQGDGTAVELGGKVRLGKDLDGPFIVSGEIDTLRGFATFLGRRFTVERGHVTLTGTEEIQPLYDVVAIHRVSDYTVTVDVRSIRDRDTGKMRPEITFRSEPDLDESDILSLLMFGKTSDRLTSSEQGSLSSQAESLAGGLASSLLERSLGKAVGLDTIDIDLGDSDTAGSVGVGRYISQDVFMSYERVFRNPQNRDQGGNAVGIEYTIRRGLKIRGTGSDFGESAIDFFFEHDY